MTEYNLQPRWVYCEICKDDYHLVERAPKCPKCGKNLITRLKSLFEPDKSADDLAK